MSDKQMRCVRCGRTEDEVKLAIGVSVPSGRRHMLCAGCVRPEEQQMLDADEAIDETDHRHFELHGEYPKHEAAEFPSNQVVERLLDEQARKEEHRG